jgi:hypothetical protein
MVTLTPDTAPSAAPPLFRLAPRGRRLWLTVHVITSVGWLGLDLGLLALGVTGRWFTPRAGELGVYRAIDLLGYAAVLPLALLAALSGVVLSLGTPWGLLRYRWVAIKLVLTVGAAAATILAGTLYTTATVLSVYKPGRRRPAPRRARP